MNNIRKSRENQMVFGVLGGFAEHFNIDPVLVRVIFILSCFLFSGVPAFFYFIFALILPEGGQQPSERYERKNQRRSYSKKTRQPRENQTTGKETDDWSDF